MEGLVLSRAEKAVFELGISFLPSRAGRMGREDSSRTTLLVAL